MKININKLESIDFNDELLLMRFWGKVQKGEGCWLWTGSKTRRGYGQLSLGQGNLVYAHRLSYVITNGMIDDGVLICHHCDNPQCVNPDHLFVGSQADNVRDMIKKGRRKGGVLPRVRSEDEIVSIRSDYASGKYLRKDLYKKYNLDKGTLSRILTGKMYSDYGGQVMEKLSSRRKLTPFLIDAIKEMHASGGANMLQIANMFSISHSMVSRVINGSR